MRARVCVYACACACVWVCCACVAGPREGKEGRGGCGVEAESGPALEGSAALRYATSLYYSTAPHYNTIHRTILLQYNTLHYSTLHYTTLHYTIHYSALLQCTTLHPCLFQLLIYCEMQMRLGQSIVFWPLTRALCLSWYLSFSKP